jgi:hypothetical protein
MSMKHGLSGRVCVCSCVCIHTTHACVGLKKYAHICVCPIQHAHIHLTRTKHAQSCTFRMQGSRCQRSPDELKRHKSPMPFAKNNTTKIPKPSLSGFMGSLAGAQQRKNRAAWHHIVFMCSLSSTLTSSRNTCNTCMMLPQAKHATGCPKGSFAFFVVRVL